MAEILDIKARYRLNHSAFNDELVLVNKTRTLELCKALKETGLIWTCQGRINQVDREILSTMKESGCIAIGYGVESVSQNILDAMKKDIKADTILPVIQMTKEIGINPIVQYMYGFPGETDETIKATLEFFRQIDYPFVEFTTTPIPGTELYQDCLKRGLIKEEEDYLLRLDSGYNVRGALINMTDFSDEEFLRKKNRLFISIMHYYLSKRPCEYTKFLLGIAVRKMKKFLS